MMFIAMNRFRVKKGSEEAFEQVWVSRGTQLTKVPSFVEFITLSDLTAAVSTIRLARSDPQPQPAMCRHH
jgi:heme-degrading monooxygenase HmoA